MGVLGCGIQGRSNIEALACRFSIEEVRAFDVDPESARRYAEDIGERLGLNVFPVDSAERAVREVMTDFPRSSYTFEVKQQYRNMKVVLDRHPGHAPAVAYLSMLGRMA